jgi:hypothetical protein
LARASSLTPYEPTGRTYVVPVAEPACGLPATSALPDFTWIEKSAEPRVPPLTVLMTVRSPVQAMSVKMFWNNAVRSLAVVTWLKLAVGFASDVISGMSTPLEPLLPDPTATE